MTIGIFGGTFLNKLLKTVAPPNETGYQVQASIVNTLQFISILVIAKQAKIEWAESQRSNSASTDKDER